MEKEFLAYARTKHSNKPNTLDYYEFGAARLIAAEIGKLRLDAVTDKEAQIFAAEYIGTLKVSTINCYLRTLRRALRLAVDWKQLDRSPKITLLVGERQREYVVPDEDWTLYIASCRQPWRDAAILIRFTGIRPDECFSLRWENAQFVEQSGLIQITTGKSRAARRTIPMLPVVWEAVHQRWEAQGNPSHGWVFPSTASCGHLTQDSAKNQHKRAI